MKIWQKRLKRSVDILFSATALVVLSPMLLLVALAVWISMGRPFLYHQVRPGLHGKLFRVHKFRTMADTRDASGKLLPDDERMTRVGKLLRKTSLDELPELWNVLTGEMSLVGPRPLMKEYLSYYTERESLRHTVRPGITGFAQVSGRNLLGWDERLELDAQYVERWSISFDLVILAKTILKVVSCSDVRMPGSIIRPLHCVRGQALDSEDRKAA